MKYLRAWTKLLRKTESINAQHKSKYTTNCGKPSVSGYMVQTFRMCFQNERQKSLRRAIIHLRISHFTIREILQRPIHTSFYNVNIFHELRTYYYIKWLSSVQWCTDKLFSDRAFHVESFYQISGSSKIHECPTDRTIVVGAENNQRKFNETRQKAS